MLPSRPSEISLPRNIVLFLVSSKEDSHNSIASVQFSSNNRTRQLPQLFGINQMTIYELQTLLSFISYKDMDTSSSKPCIHHNPQTISRMRRLYSLQRSYAFKGYCRLFKIVILLDLPLQLGLVTTREDYYLVMYYVKV